MKRIIVADDEHELAQCIKDALGSEYQVDIVHSGLEVLKLYKQKKDLDPYHVLILDVNFSAGINGLEVANLIRQQDREIRILIFSAYDYSDIVRQRAFDMGAEFRAKPLDPIDIHKFIQDAPL
ncbi:response regulator transcription factor [Spirulina sp. 06S082]|uniref:response regulator transcription factor n=1 Tax=Spirulina sp. 06S082 TaxID=3110248 RepID=UPI002B1FC552|nr:response regulator [Spirulina sp. 06S082]MEA5468290.1 response regulator [Spirulina sp. 06S082]